MSLTRSTPRVMTNRVLVLFAGLIGTLVATHGQSTVEQRYFFTFPSLAAAQALLIVKYVRLSEWQKRDDVFSL